MRKSYLIKRIKNTLMQGGLCLVERRSGKTLAIVELLRENPQFRVLVHGPDMRNIYVSEHGIDSKRIFTPDLYEQMIRGTGFNSAKHLLIDEYFICRSPPYHFFAATASTHFPIRPIMVDLPQLEPDEIIEAMMDGYLTKKQYENQIEGLEKEK